MQRYFSNKLEDNKFELNEDDLYHIKHVMRMKTGDKVEVVFIGDVYICNLEIINSNINVFQVANRKSFLWFINGKIRGNEIKLYIPLDNQHIEEGANQLFDFEQPYIRINDGRLIESYIVKDKNEALAVNKVMPIHKSTSFKTREELEKLFEKPSGENESLYYLHVSRTYI